MAWWDTPQPKQDDPQTGPLTHVEVDPDHTPETEEEEPFTHYTAPGRDKDGWPVFPTRNDRPPLWRR
jgi:hypothetical protein